MGNKKDRITKLEIEVEQLKKQWTALGKALSIVEIPRPDPPKYEPYGYSG